MTDSKTTRDRKNMKGSKRVMPQMGEVRKENIKYIIWKHRRQGCDKESEGHETIWREPRDSNGF